MTRAPEALERLAQNLWLERELLRVDELLVDIPFVVFKGVFLSRRLFGDLTQRVSADNDILVREADGERALRRLLDAGYSPVLVGLDPGDALVRTGQVALELSDEERRPSLDLHVRAFSANFFRVDESWLWENHLRVVELHGRRFRVFDDPLAFVHLVAHYLQHLFEDARLDDVARGVEQIAREVGEEELDDVVRRTVGWRAVWFATAMAGSPFALARDAARSTSFQRRSSALFRRLGIATSPTFLRGAFAVWLTDRKAWPEAARRAFFPAAGELRARYGPGARGALLVRHFRHRLLGR